MSSQFENIGSNEAENSTIDGQAQELTDDGCVIKKKRKKTSKVWDDFDLVDIPKIGQKAVCRYCKERYAHGGKGSSTSHLKRHSEACFQKKMHISSLKSQPTIPFKSSNTSVNPFWRVKEVIDKALDDQDTFMKDMATTMKKKFDKYWGECNLLMAIACVLDPRCKFHVVNICFPLIYKPTDVCEENIEKVKTSLQMLYDEYVEMAKEEAGTDVSGEGDGGCNPSSSHRSNSSVLTGFDQIMSIVRKNEAVPPTKSELQTYLEEGVHIPDGGTSTFSALEWWKNNSMKYKILSKMAADILAIPISTVASESTFSVGRRVIDDYRSKLNEDSIEALICGGDWLRNKYGLKKTKEIDQEQEMA